MNISVIIVYKKYNLNKNNNGKGDMDSKIFGKKLRELRKVKGYTQQVLAELIDIDEKHLSRLENGKYFPTYQTLSKILNVLGVSIDELGIETDKIEVVENPLLIKSMHILNNAKNNDELKCYLLALKLTQRALNLPK